MEEETTAISVGEAQEEEEDQGGKLVCPICNIQFERSPENARNLVVHVDEHLVEELKCPVCFIVFNIKNQNAYENHVNVSLYNLFGIILSVFAINHSAKYYHPVQGVL